MSNSNVVGVSSASAYTASMDARTWQLYCTVVESQGVTATAERFFLSQPAVSMQLQKLEHHFGAKLLYPRGRQMLPTEAGRAVYRHAKEVLKAEAEVTTIVREFNEGASGQAVIGATHMIGCYFVPALLSRFKRSRPEADIAVQIMPKDRLFPALLAGELDFA